mgnify:CR=1 FL=1
MNYVNYVFILYLVVLFVYYLFQYYFYPPSLSQKICKKEKNRTGTVTTCDNSTLANLKNEVFKFFIPLMVIGMIFMFVWTTLTGRWEYTPSMGSRRYYTSPKISPKFSLLSL